MTPLRAKIRRQTDSIGYLFHDGSNKENSGIFFSILMSVVVAKVQIINTLCLNHKLRKRRILNMIARIEQRQGISSRLMAIKGDREKRRFWDRPG